MATGQRESAPHPHFDLRASAQRRAERKDPQRQRKARSPLRRAVHRTCATPGCDGIKVGLSCSDVVDHNLTLTTSILYRFFVTLTRPFTIDLARFFNALHVSIAPSITSSTLNESAMQSFTATTATTTVSAHPRRTNAPSHNRNRNHGLAPTRVSARPNVFQLLAKPAQVCWDPD